MTSIAWQTFVQPSVIGLFLLLVFAQTGSVSAELTIGREVPAAEIEVLLQAPTPRLGSLEEVRGRVLTAAEALGANDASVLAYGDSGDVTGDTDGVVGYVSAAIHGGAA